MKNLQAKPLLQLVKLVKTKTIFSEIIPQDHDKSKHKCQYIQE